MPCSCCGGPLARLGVLGRFLWLRCINCGMQFSRTLAADANGELVDDFECEDDNARLESEDRW